MALLPPTKQLLGFLRANPAIRARVAAPADSTLLYAGTFFGPMWREVERLKLTNPDLSAKQVLPDVLARIHTPGQPQPTLLDWAKALEALVPWQDNGFIVWRALSGIFASNAVGTVSFAIGSDIHPGRKVFAATELPVLLRNQRVDPLTKDILAYYRRCMQQGQQAVNFGFIGA